MLSPLWQGRGRGRPEGAVGRRRQKGRAGAREAPATPAGRGLNASGDRVAQIERLAEDEWAKAAAAGRGGENAAGSAGGSGPHLTAASAPSNLHALDNQQLREVCAAHGLRQTEDSSTDELIALLESRSEALEGLGEGGLEGAPKRLRCAGSEEDSASDSGDDAAYRPMED